MGDVNKVILLGRLGTDPETREFGSGSVCNFRMATSRKWTDKATGEKREKTQWHNISCWGPMQNVAQNWLHKGDQVYLEGEIEYREYEKADGSKGYATDIRVREISLIGNRTGNAPTQAAEPKKQDAVVEDDLPF
jgi:single-strand DNA-binding protein